MQSLSNLYLKPIPLFWISDSLIYLLTILHLISASISIFTCSNQSSKGYPQSALFLLSTISENDDCIPPLVLAKIFWVIIDYSIKNTAESTFEINNGYVHFSWSPLLPLKFKPPWFLDWIIVAYLDFSFLLLPHYDLFSTLQPEWLYWNETQIIPYLCSKPAHGFLSPNIFARLLTIPFFRSYSLFS